MGQILLPKQYHQDFAQPGKKPIGPVALDESHQIFDKILHSWVFNESAGSVVKDLKGSSDFTAFNGPQWQAGIKGKELKFDGTNDFASALIDMTGHDVFTILMEMFIPSYANDDALALEHGPNTNSTPGFFIDPRAAGGNFDLAQGDGLSNFHISNFARPSIGRHTYVFRFDQTTAGVGQIEAHVDGLAQAMTDSLTASLGPVIDEQTMYMSSRAGSSLFGPYGISYLSIIDGLVTDGLARSLSLKPYQILKPATAQIYNFPSVAAVTSATTGTAVPTQTEAEVVTGGKTIILTLTGDTFVTGTSSEDGIAAGSDSDQAASGTNWDSLVKSALDNTDVVLSGGDTVATITLPAFATYDISSTETITWTIPAASLTTSADPIVSSPTHTVTAVSAGITIPVVMNHLRNQGIA